MEYIYIGEVVNTHGIKGELRIVSDFQYKKQTFVKEMTVYLGKRKQAMKIVSYRVHKSFDMVTFEGITNINDAIIFKGDAVYIKRDSIKIDGYFNEDLLNLDVVADEQVIGKVQKIIKSPAHYILVVSGEKNFMVPYVDEYIKEIDIEKNYIAINIVEGLIDED